MSDLWFAGSADPWGYGGFSGPDPVTEGSTGWTWDVEFETTETQSTYARTSLNRFATIGGGTCWALSGIVSYRTRDSRGVDVDHPVGESHDDGLADYMFDVAVDNVTFGWTLEADNDFSADINMEIWVTG
jgi:hypothetical protein